MPPKSEQKKSEKSKESDCGICKWTTIGAVCTLYYGDSDQKQSLVITLIAVVISAYMEHDRIASTVRRFAHPNLPPLSVPDPFLLPRPEQESILNILKPTDNIRTFYLVTGEHGTGKTTLVRQACWNVSTGVIYVEVPADYQLFAPALANAVDFHFDLPVWTERAVSDFSVVLNHILVAAREYRNIYGVPPVLVIDDINILVEHDRTNFDILLRAAKKAADDRVLIVVLVSSEGKGPRYILSIIIFLVFCFFKFKARVLHLD